jgi:hypothetical protein
VPVSPKSAQTSPYHTRLRILHQDKKIREQHAIAVFLFDFSVFFYGTRLFQNFSFGEASSARPATLNLMEKAHF